MNCPPRRWYLLSHREGLEEVTPSVLPIIKQASLEMGRWPHMSACHKMCLVESCVSLSLYHYRHDRMRWPFRSLRRTPPPYTRVLAFRLLGWIGLTTSSSHFLFTARNAMREGANIPSLLGLFFERMTEVAGTATLSGGGHIN